MQSSDSDIDKLILAERKPIPLEKPGKPGEWRPLHQPGDAVESWFRWDGKSQRFEVKYSQDVEGILEWNKAAATHNDGYSPSRNMKRTAEIPLIFVHKWLEEEGWDAFDPNAKKQLKRKLNDPDWRFLRTAPGHV